MDSYEIIMTPDATIDLIELRDYIADVLFAPDTALNYIRAIRAEIGKLEELPGRIKAIDEEPWHTRGIRRIIAKNFFVYFRIDEQTKRVYILNIIYGKRDQLRALTHINPDYI